MSASTVDAPVGVASVTSYGRPRPGALVAPPAAPKGHRHQPALDGLRGLAVLGVVLYHAGVHWLPGGLLGVDAFFVLSGFLITTLLLQERRRSGTVDLKRFWVRRARRLLPALGVLLVTVSAMVAVTGTATEKESYPRDAASAILYVANWRFAYSHQGYFSDPTPSPLLHLWSLGVEEQFYVLWPVVVALLLGVGFLGRRLRRREPSAAAGAIAIGRFAVGGVIASTLLMAVLAIRGTGVDRLYYGTDTRAAPLLVGAALAVALTHRDRPRAHARAAGPASGHGPAATLAGVVALVGLGALWTTTSGQAAWLYRGGFTLAAVAVAVVIAAVWNRPRSPLARVLAVAPLAVLGRISYGVYLYHWPLFLLLDHSRTHLAGGALLALRLATTLTVAVVSYTFLERPVQVGALSLPRPRLLVPATAAMTVGAVLLVATLPGSRTAAGAGSSSSLESDAARLQQQMQQRLDRLPLPSASPSTTAPASSSAPATARSTPAPAPSTSKPPTGPVKIFIVGDSIAFSAAWALTAERQPYQVDLLSDAVVGCGIVPLPYGDPNSTSPVPLDQCPDWQGQWTTAVAKFQPAVTAVFLGRWETVDRVENGQVVHIGQPAYDAQLSALLDQTVKTLSARGGKVAFVALPCYQLPELADGSTSPADQPVRQARYNQLIHAAAARHPGVASVVDMNAQICPAGQPISSWNGIPLRQDDGMHFNVLSGPALGPLLLEPLRRLAGVSARP